ncbi:hypothetical protein ZOSMA_112G00020 [Zostera marina]|uniref:Uncharacterized protein n=1 Tax=Zostera marina TaxID=29655 RepID=A0A0K9Q318_ZOSMR|nr:hypothetical protein ZOSMA_112G00020 [Zostera marina]
MRALWTLIGACAPGGGDWVVQTPARYYIIINSWNYRPLVLRSSSSPDN